MMDTTDALCKDISMEFWFPPAFDESPTGKDSEYYDVAKMVCSVCPLQSECAVLGRDEVYGVWGGTSPLDRRRGSTVRSKRLANLPALQALPRLGERVDIPTVKVTLRKLTRKRPQAG